MPLINEDAHRVKVYAYLGSPSTDQPIGNLLFTKHSRLLVSNSRTNIAALTEPPHAMSPYEVSKLSQVCMYDRVCKKYFAGVTPVLQYTRIFPYYFRFARSAGFLPRVWYNHSLYLVPKYRTTGVSIILATKSWGVCTFFSLPMLFPVVNLFASNALHNPSRPRYRMMKHHHRPRPPASLPRRCDAAVMRRASPSMMHLASN